MAVKRSDGNGFTGWSDCRIDNAILHRLLQDTGLITVDMAIMVALTFDCLRR